MVFSLISEDWCDAQRLEDGEMWHWEGTAQKLASAFEYQSSTDHFTFLRTPNGSKGERKGNMKCPIGKIIVNFGSAINDVALSFRRESKGSSGELWSRSVTIHFKCLWTRKCVERTRSNDATRDVFMNLLCGTSLSHFQNGLGGKVYQFPSKGFVNHKEHQQS